VRQRAAGRCEYCGIRQQHVSSRFQIEHIVAKQHGGSDDDPNLALACDRCNAFKGPNLSGIDPQTGTLVPLFHPRKDRWHDHFHMNRAVVVGRTDVGRATVGLLNMNAPNRVRLRRQIGRSAAPPKR
jgi:hypothetical protein